MRRCICRVGLWPGWPTIPTLAGSPVWCGTSSPSWNEPATGPPQRVDAGPVVVVEGAAAAFPALCGTRFVASCPAWSPSGSRCYACHLDALDGGPHPSSPLPIRLARRCRPYDRRRVRCPPQRENCCRNEALWQANTGTDVLPLFESSWAACPGARRHQAGVHYRVPRMPSLRAAARGPAMSPLGRAGAPRAPHHPARCHHPACEQGI
jgi:hypothetical protein